jgi:hypothetical protein
MGKGTFTHVICGGHVYGFGIKGLQCVDLEDGKTEWNWRAKGKESRDQGEITLVGDKLVWLSTSGVLYAGDASPDADGPSAQFNAIGQCTKDIRKDKARYNSICCVAPTFAEGRFYCRSPWGTVVCVDVSK